MSEPLYVPVLPTRPHATKAYESLLPYIQRSVAPLWSLPSRTNWPLSELATAFRKDLATVAKAQRFHPAWVDAPFVGETQIPVLDTTLREASVLRPLRPVTGPKRPRVQQVSALDTARQTGDGVGVRVHMPGEWDGALTEKVRELLARTDPSVPVDLLLDLDAVLEGRPDAGKETLRALDSLVGLAPWRTIATIGAGVVQPSADMFPRNPCEQPRWDWEMWREVAQSDRAYVPSLIYGDYGIQPAAALSREQRLGQRGGPPWGVVCYTVEQFYAIAKMLRSGDDSIAHNRETLRELLNLPGFRGPAAGAAEAWLRDRAYDRGAKKTGNPSDWLWVGNSQHMTYIVRSLRV